MKTSAEIDKLAVAMAKAQAAFKAAKKESANPFFKSKYADLSSVWEAVSDSLEANGLSVLQGFGTDGGQNGHLWTMLLHTSGQYIQGECPLILPKQDPQGMGSATTYMRRYALAAMLGVVQEDDDGNAATHGKPAPGASSHEAAHDILADWAAKMDEFSTLEGLQAFWVTVPRNLQPALAKAKEAAKQRIGGK